MEQFREYDEDHQIRVILSEERLKNGKRRIIYRCDRCREPAEERQKYATKGLVFCKHCQRQLIYIRRRERERQLKEQDPNWHRQHYRMREYEDLDRGTVFALYRAGRSVKWIADDQQAKIDAVERMVKEIFGKERKKA